MHPRKLLIALLLISFPGFGQTTKVYKDITLKYSELQEILNAPELDTVQFERVKFVGDLGRTDWMDSTFGTFGEYRVSKPIVTGRIGLVHFFECSFNVNVFMQGPFGGNLAFSNCTGPEELILDGVEITSLWISKCQFTHVAVHHSRVRDLDINHEAENSTVSIYRTDVSGFAGILGNRLSIQKSNFALAENSFIENDGLGSTVWTSIEDSRFQSPDSVFFQFIQRNGSLRVMNCTFGSGVDFYGQGETVTWNISANTFEKEVGFRSDASIGESSYINFRETFKDRMLGWHVEKNGKEIFYSADGDQIADTRFYTNLLRMHKRFHDFYLKGGDILSANYVYTRIKDLETRHLKYEYDQSPSFDHWTRIKLNQLLWFYTRYGTDPARAIIISFWVVLAFGFVYIFFPSSWDVTSKSKVLTDLIELRSLKEGRLRKSMVILVSALFILLNAFTLSLNSFITLGFGEIPTKGFARYMTIIEGSMGWLLLTLFSVALISQSSF